MHKESDTLELKQEFPSRKEVQEKLGIKQTKCGLLLKDIENRGLIIRTGSGKATGYSAKR